MSEQIEIITPLQTHEFLDSWYELSDEKHFWFVWRLRAFLQQLKDLKIPTNSSLKVLDVGCGAGILKKQLEAATDWSVDATDLDYSALQKIENGRGQVFYYDVTTKYDEFKEKYDAILLFDVLEHIEITPPFIESLLFHLKKDGFLFINVPALQTLYSKYDEVAGHFRRYNTNDLPKEFTGFSLKAKDIRFWGLINVPLLFLRKQILSLFGKNKSEEKIIQQGFKPPNPLSNKILLELMKIETQLLKSPPFGSSVLMVLQKT